MTFYFQLPTLVRHWILRNSITVRNIQFLMKISYVQQENLQNLLLHSIDNSLELAIRSSLAATLQVMEIIHAAFCSREMRTEMNIFCHAIRSFPEKPRAMRDVLIQRKTHMAFSSRLRIVNNGSLQLIHSAYHS